MTDATGGGEATTGDVLWDGFIAGALGAVTVALWFLILDLFHGHPLHTPALLGTALLEGAAAASEMEGVHPDVVAVYSGIHMGLFALFGVAIAWAIRAFKRTPVIGYLLVFAFVLFEFGFYVVILAVGQPVVGSVSAWAVLVGNLLAALVMGGYFLVRNPDLLRGGFDTDAERSDGARG